MNVQRMDNVAPTTMSSTSLVYTDTYTIPQLSTDDDDERYECRLAIHTSPAVRDMDTVTLDVTGKCIKLTSTSLFMRAVI